MANDFTVNPIVIDTPGVSALITYDVQVSKIRWVSKTGTAGDDATVQDQYGNTFWISVCPGANYVEESDFTTYKSQRHTLKGILVPTLDSGTLYIYQ